MLQLIGRLNQTQLKLKTMNNTTHTYSGSIYSNTEIKNFQILGMLEKPKKKSIYFGKSEYTSIIVWRGAPLDQPWPVHP